MSHQVQIAAQSVQFSVEEHQTILQAALDHGVNLPHACKTGNCGGCRCKVLDGNYLSSAPTGVSNGVNSDDSILTCQTYALSDILLDVPNFCAIPVKNLPAKITYLHKDNGLAILKLTLPANQKFEFIAGQFIDVTAQGITRSYSVASAPNNTQQLELHIRYRQGGAFSEILWNSLAVGSLVRIKGPLGNFSLKNSVVPLLLVATGTGFAPLKAILEHLRDTNSSQHLHLVWGNYRPEDFYLRETLAEFQQFLKLTVALCASESAVTGFYSGMVTDYISENFADLSNYEVYACGNPAMITAVSELTINKLQLPPHNFFADSFSPTNLQ